MPNLVLLCLLLTEQMMAARSILPALQALALTFPSRAVAKCTAGINVLFPMPVDPVRNGKIARMPPIHRLAPCQTFLVVAVAPVSWTMETHRVPSTPNVHGMDPERDA